MNINVVSYYVIHEYIKYSCRSVNYVKIYKSFLVCKIPLCKKLCRFMKKFSSSQDILYLDTKVRLIHCIIFKYECSAPPKKFTYHGAINQVNYNFIEENFYTALTQWPFCGCCRQSTSHCADSVQQQTLHHRQPGVPGHHEPLSCGRRVSCLPPPHRWGNQTRIEN